MYSYRKLAVWRRAHALVLHIHEVTERNYRGRYGSLIEEMRWTAMGVPSLIADAGSQSANTDRLMILARALESIEDLDYRVLLARDVGLITLSDHVRLDARLEEVTRMLVAIRDRLRVRGNQTALDSRFRGNDEGVDSRFRGNDGGVDSRFRGNDGGVDSRFRGNDEGVDSRFRGKTSTSSPRKRGSSVVRLRSRQPSG